jgi:hypothetical protein
MKLVARSFLSVLIAASALLALGCPDRTRIGDIEANPSRYQNKEVVIAGTVKDSYGINIPGTQMRGGAYKVDDGSGAIWIFTEEGVPTKGAQVGVKGIIGSGVNWHGKNYGLGLYEKDRRFQKR